MKKILFLLIAIATFTTSFAQGQGAVTVINNSDCDVTVGVYATCPNSSNFNHTANASYVILAHKTVMLWSPLSIPPSSGWLYGYPWVEAPDCLTWQWNYATVGVVGVSSTLSGIGVDLSASNHSLPSDLFSGGQIFDMIATTGCSSGFTSFNWVYTSSGDINIIVY